MKTYKIGDHFLVRRYPNDTPTLVILCQTGYSTVQLIGPDSCNRWSDLPVVVSNVRSVTEEELRKTIQEEDWLEDTSGHQIYPKPQKKD